MPYIGAGIQKFNTADGLTVNGTAEVTGASTLTGAVTADAGVSIDNITIDGTEIDLSSGNLTLDVAGDINLDADGGDVNFKDGGTSIGYLSNSSGTLLLGVNTSDADFKVQGSDGGSTINALTIDMSEAGAATFNAGVTSESVIVTGTANRGLKISSAANSSGQNDADAVYDAQDTEGGGTGNHIFKIGGNEKTRISDGGNLLIGATSRSNVERVNISYPRTTHCGMVIDCTDSTAATAAIKFFNPNGDVGSIDMSGSSTSYNTSSDYRLKENVADMTGAIARVKQLAPKRFNFIADADTIVDGFLAHEAQTVVPEAITGTHNEIETWTQQQIDDGDAPDGTSAGDNKLDDDGNTIPVMQGIDQSKLVPLLTGALKEAITKIETLETEMTALKARVTALEDA